MNLFVNGNPQVQQRGVSFSNLASGFTADRWYFTMQGGAQNEIALGRGGAAPGGAGTIDVRRPQGSTATGQMSLYQSLPTLESMTVQGSNVVFTVWARAGANFSASALSLTIIGSTGIDQLSGTIGSWAEQSVLASASVVPSGIMKPYSVPAIVPVNVTQLAGVLTWTPKGTAGAADSILFGGFDFRPGWMPPVRLDAEAYGASYMKCVEFYEELARLDGGEPVCLCEMGLTPQQPNGMSWVQSYVQFLPKRFWKRLVVDFSPSMATDYHVSPLNGQPIYGLTVQVPSDHRSPTRQFIQAGWNGDAPPGYVPGMMMNFAVDSKPQAATPKFAINADL